MEKQFQMSVEEAVEFIHQDKNINISKETIRGWCTKYSIGKKIVGRWFIDESRLRALLDGEDNES